MRVIELTLLTSEIADMDEDFLDEYGREEFYYLAVPESFLPKMYNLSARMLGTEKTELKDDGLNFLHSEVRIFPIEEAFEMENEYRHLFGKSLPVVVPAKTQSFTYKYSLIECQEMMDIFELIEAH